MTTVTLVLDKHMNLFNIIDEMGLEPHKTSASGGGEYHCPCPACGGNDRFMFWPEEGRYWCRQCDAKGDAIQFCRDFLGLSFRAACLKAQRYPKDIDCRLKAQTDSSPIRVPSHSWESKAKSFIEKSVQRLLIDTIAMEPILQRGLSPDSIKKHRLGWNPVKAFYRRSEWGLEETGERQWICLPTGIVIPIFEGSDIRKLKIRKSDWDKENVYGKYYEVPGSSNMLPIFGSTSSNAVVIVEAEFDAMLIAQEAGDLCACVALGGAQKRPSHTLRQWLLNKKLILFALDFDEAGKKEYFYWQQFYQNLEPWPVPDEKSPEDYFKTGGKIRDWISSGICLEKKS